MSTELPANAAPDPGDLGFWIRRLVLAGPDVRDASLEFAEGLNVVSGPSNTGKSFAFYCIDYMLGASRLRKHVAEARHYRTAYLEIGTHGGGVYTLRRSLSGGNFGWFEGALEVGRTSDHWEDLAARHAADRSDTASAQFLALSGFQNNVLRKNQRNEKRSVSFRDVVNLVLVDEERVIKDDSPVLSAQVVNHTAEKSLFRLILTGEDDAALEGMKAVKERKGRLQAQVDLLEEMLGGAGRGNDEGGTVGVRAEVEARAAQLAERIAAVQDELGRVTGDIDEVLSAIDAQRGVLTVRKSRLLVVGELLSRFGLLKQSYKSDLERLGFVTEGAHLLQQLPLATCPVCGTEWDSKHANHTNNLSLLNIDVLELANAEAEKIYSLMSDLDEAIADLDQERLDIQTAVVDLEDDLRRRSNELDQSLKPALNTAQSELQRFMSERNEVLQRLNRFEERERLRERRNELVRILDGLKEARADAPDPEMAERAAEGLEQHIETLLDMWTGGDSDVKFDWETFDLEVNGRSRKNQGKGVRAIWYAAFVVGLARFAESMERPHPRFTILDSPLTTFRGPDRPTSGPAPDEVSSAVERAFFESLAETSGHSEGPIQVIVFENKEPPEEVREKMTYTRFTGTFESGRAGFVPVD
jgi:hypothetical protein